MRVLPEQRNESEFLLPIQFMNCLFLPISQNSGVYTLSLCDPQGLLISVFINTFTITECQFKDEI